MNITRRRLATVAAVVVCLLGGLSCSPPPEKPAEPPAPPPTLFDLDEATIADLQQRMTSGQDTARSLTERYLARIEAIDRQGPTLRAVLEVNPDALTIADGLDAERKAGRVRGPLHGIPILIKDNIGTADKMETTAGSLALVGARPPRDAFIVERLRESGAVILGKTNLGEWANFRSTQSTNGWSARGGQTLNPYALDRSPIGSSSGSGSAVAANLIAAAVGTETDGSIIAPSSAQALVGIKPTIGLLSRTGIVPIAHSQDTAGPMARTVTDAAILLGAMAGEDASDASTKGSTAKAQRDYTPFLDAGGLKGARIGIVRARMFGTHAATDQLAEAAIAVLKQQGAVIVDPADIPTLGEFDGSELTVLMYEFKADLQKYFEWVGASATVRSLGDVIAFNEAHKDQEMPIFGQDIMVRADKMGPLTSAEYRRALEQNGRLARTQGIDAVMNKLKLDALVAPSMLPATLIDPVNGDGVPYSALGSSSPMQVAAVAGYPHITVPMGFVQGLPVGLSFFGRAWSEPTLIKVAYAYEQATKHRRPPTFAESAK